VSRASELKSLGPMSPMDVDEAAMFCGRAQVEVRLAARAGTIPFTESDGRMLFDPFDLVRYVLPGTPTELQIVQKARELEAAMPRWWVARAQPVEFRGRVYLMETTEGPHRLKIGFSTNPDQRLYGIATASPVGVRLLLSVPGTLADERALHLRFADCHVRGEWFDGVARFEIERAMEDLVHG
jgi:hypothetical protein